MSRGKTGSQGSAEDIKLQITPMIDVTFLLLIFFMLLPFRSLERKVAAFLPKDRGLAKTKIKLEEKPKITVELKRKRTERITRVKLLDQEIGSGMEGLALLKTRIKAIANANDELPGEINAWAWVPHRDVVQAIDAFMLAEVKDLTFVGAPPPGKGQSGAGDPDATGDPTR
jgi:biopolymer transport protein ExbD